MYMFYKWKKKWLEIILVAAGFQNSDLSVHQSTICTHHKNLHYEYTLVLIFSTIDVKVTKKKSDFFWHQTFETVADKIWIYPMDPKSVASKKVKVCQGTLARSIHPGVNTEQGQNTNSKFQGKKKSKR